MTKYALDQTRAQMQVCTLYFGKAPYENVTITEQPNFNFGQSWPNLVYLPISAYIDSTQRWMLFGQIDTKFTGFVQEVTPHEVAHQWFGHGVGWASYHDQWLSEGFAEFAAGLFLQQAMGPKWQKDYIEFWERQRMRILEKNNFGVSPNDAGPLWLGVRLISPRSPQCVPGRNLFQGRLRAADAAVDDVRRSRDGRQTGAGFHGHDARLHGTPPRHAGFHRIFQSRRRKAHDQADGHAAEWAAGLVFQRMGVRTRRCRGTACNRQ